MNETKNSECESVFQPHLPHCNPLRQDYDDAVQAKEVEDMKKENKVRKGLFGKESRDSRSEKETQGNFASNRWTVAAFIQTYRF